MIRARMILTRTRFEDFERFWRTFSGSGAELRRKHGCRGARVFRDRENEHEVRVLFDWDREGWERFFEDPAAAEIMEAAGLRGHPEPTFLEPAGELDA